MGSTQDLSNVDVSSSDMGSSYSTLEASDVASHCEYCQIWALAHQCGARPSIHSASGSLLSDSSSEADLPGPSSSSSIPSLTKEDDHDLFQPVYPGARISLCGAMCAIMQFCLTHHLYILRGVPSPSQL